VSECFTISDNSEGEMAEMSGKITASMTHFNRLEIMDLRLFLRPKSYWKVKEMAVRMRTTEA
jgi:hypothetical protein